MKIVIYLTGNDLEKANQLSDQVEEFIIQQGITYIGVEAVE